MRPVGGGACVLLVHCELDRATAARTALAADLARRSGAALIGAAAAAPSPAAAGYPPLSRALAERSERERLEALDLVQQRFVERVADLAETAWRSGLGPAAALLAEESCAADLVVMGPSRDPDGSLFFADPGDVVMNSGRPVLIAPDELERLDLRQVVVGWKATRASRRALLDSAPWLALAERVLVVAVEEQPGDGAHLEDVRDWLSRRCRHVDAELRRGGSRPAADALLDIADATGAGLVVAGAYSHPPLQERLFGGVTRELLRRGRAARMLSH